MARINLNTTIAAALLALTATISLAAPASAQVLENRQEQVEDRRENQDARIKKRQDNQADR